METAFYNGELIIASQAAKKYDTEKEIRGASSSRLLLCTDSDCKCKVLHYCHGELGTEGKFWTYGGTKFGPAGGIYNDCGTDENKNN